MTYAELTLPRNRSSGGYAQMRPSSSSTSSSNNPEPSVIYARIDHNNRQQIHPTSSNHLMIGHQGAPGGAGGGISPNSLMNTSLDSSSASSTSTRQKKAPSSVEDEGFNSCSGIRTYVVSVIGEDGIFFRGGAGPQFSSRRGRDFST